MKLLGMSPTEGKKAEAFNTAVVGLGPFLSFNKLQERWCILHSSNSGTLWLTYLVCSIHTLLVVVAPAAFIYILNFKHIDYGSTCCCCGWFPINIKSSRSMQILGNCAWQDPLEAPVLTMEVAVARTPTRSCPRFATPLTEFCFHVWHFCIQEQPWIWSTRSNHLCSKNNCIIIFDHE